MAVLITNCIRLMILLAGVLVGVERVAVVVAKGRERERERERERGTDRQPDGEVVIYTRITMWNNTCSMN